MSILLKILKFILKFILFTIISICSVLLIINLYVILSVKSNILTVENSKNLSNIDCILVLGCSVNPDKSPSDMLADRVTVSTQLYQNGVSDKLLMSGDHSSLYYNEVGAMKNFAKGKGVKSSSIFLDHSGFSTYESVYRAKKIYGAKKIVIVTQKYHLYRAMYIAKQLGIEAYGVPSDLRHYSKPVYREVREILARIKDFYNIILGNEPKCQDNPVPLKGSGDVTDR